MNKDQTQPEQSTPAQSSPGNTLRIARERLGLSQQQVAEQLRLRLTSIQHVENDEHEKGVSITFTKGYVRMYAKLVGLDAQPLLNAFDDIHKDESAPAKLQSFSKRTARQANDERWMLVTYLMLFLVVGSVVVWWFQQSDKSIGTRFGEFSDNVVEQVQSLSGDDSAQRGAQAVADQTAEQSVTPAPKAAQIEEPTETNEISSGSEVLPNDELLNDINEVAENASVQSLVTEPLDELSQTIVDEQATQIPEQANEPLVAAQDTEEALDELTQEVNDNIGADITELLSATNDQGYQVNADGTVELVFTFKDDCWVSVKDKDGETMAYGVKKQGRIMRVSGLPPVRVILGAPQNVEISFAGKDVDMSVHEPGRSANFELSLTGE